MILHQTQGSHDSSDSGSLPPSYSRLPPDGHEFPEDYVYRDPSLQDSGQGVSRKSSASSTSSLDRHQLRSNTVNKKKVQTQFENDHLECKPNHSWNNQPYFFMIKLELNRHLLTFFYIKFV